MHNGGVVKGSVSLWRFEALGVLGMSHNLALDVIGIQTSMMWCDVFCSHVCLRCRLWWTWGSFRSHWCPSSQWWGWPPLSYGDCWGDWPPVDHWYCCQNCLELLERREKETLSSHTAKHTRWLDFKDTHYSVLAISDGGGWLWKLWGI